MRYLVGVFLVVCMKNVFLFIFRMLIIITIMTTTTAIITITKIPTRIRKGKGVFLQLDQLKAIETSIILLLDQAIVS
jgi:hypothetical protein